MADTTQYLPKDNSLDEVAQEELGYIMSCIHPLLYIAFLNDNSVVCEDIFQRLFRYKLILINSFQQVLIYLINLSV